MFYCFCGCKLCTPKRFFVIRLFFHIIFVLFMIKICRSVVDRPWRSAVTCRVLPRGYEDEDSSRGSTRPHVSLMCLFFAGHYFDCILYFILCQYVFWTWCQSSHPGWILRTHCFWNIFIGLISVLTAKISYQNISIVFRFVVCCFRKKTSFLS